MPRVDPNSTDVCHHACLCYAKDQTKGFVHARLALYWVLVLIDIPHLGCCASEAGLKQAAHGLSETHSAAQAVLNFAILLPPLPEC